MVKLSKKKKATSSIITFEIEAELRDALSKFSVDKDRKRSEQIRRILKDFFDEDIIRVVLDSALRNKIENYAEKNNRRIDMQIIEILEAYFRRKK